MPPRKRTEVTDVHRRQIEMHIEEGKSVRAIAEAVGLSKSTVAAYAKELKEAGYGVAEESDPGSEPALLPVEVPADAPNYDPLLESRRLLYLAEQELKLRHREAYQKLATDARNAYALHVKTAPPDPLPTEEQPDMVEAAAQARLKLGAQLERCIKRAQERGS